MTRQQWADAFLKAIGAPVTKRNELVIVSWAQAEGGAANWNPLNTTHDAPGAWNYNWVGVKEYPSFEVGLKATADTLNYGADRNQYGYRAIRRLLRESARPKRTLRAIERSEWGTGGLALKVLPYARDNFTYYASFAIAS